MTIQNPRPHNREGLDLRKNPVCYLCGQRWWQKRGLDRKLIVVVCSSCGTESYALHDHSVMEARHWKDDLK